MPLLYRTEAQIGLSAAAIAAAVYVVGHALHLLALWSIAQ